MNDKESASRNTLAERRTRLAAYRTAMAADRSLMAWVRTGISMIGLGFTVYKFLQAVRTEHIAERATPRDVGLFLIGLGVVSVVLGLIDDWTTIREIRKSYPFSYWRWSVFSAIALAIFGLYLFISISVRF